MHCSTLAMQAHACHPSSASCLPLLHTSMQPTINQWQHLHTRITPAMYQCKTARMCPTSSQENTRFKHEQQVESSRSWFNQCYGTCISISTKTRASKNMNTMCKPATQTVLVPPSPQDALSSASRQSMLSYMSSHCSMVNSIQLCQGT
jgi:hypothetical protein